VAVDVVDPPSMMVMVLLLMMQNDYVRGMVVPLLNTVGQQKQQSKLLPFGTI
jgi:hypothetical protein